MATAMDVAQYFLAVAPEGDITPLKLQKLCAYAQAVSLGFHGKPLFGEELEAWTHGPVVPSVYQEYKAYGNAPITSMLDVKTAVQPFTQNERYVLQMTWATYGRFTAWALRQQSHWDFPGDFASRGKIIDKEQIRQRFEHAQLVDRMRANESADEAARAVAV